ncbi:glycosyltransferase [Hoeflea sp. G2-23]|uniref:Glycosyltransferase n=1 Tax=Hoeflea algicola TaxID=2983763 RepID=A0ABT3ZC93_9HYPH|nr:glycosyltransferase [Hoeflea algicola]MCY0149420.1 glycosyltransferase [Hoeflea algicola]
MKILFVCNDLDYFLAHRTNLLGPLLARGHQLSLCTGGSSKSAGQLPEGVDFIPVTLTRHSLNLVSDARLTARYARIVADMQPDVVHCITVKPNLFMTLALAVRRLRGTKSPRLILTFPGLGKVFEPAAGFMTGLRRRAVATVLRAGCRLLECSATFENQSDRDVLVDAGVFTAAQTRVIAGAGLNMGIYAPPSEPLTGKLSFLFASRLLKAKGVGTFLETARCIRAEGGDARFLLAGDAEPGNPDRFDMAEVSAAHDRGDITYLGALSTEQMVLALQQADVTCLPTRLREGLPRILIEAAACGCALIASDQPVIRQVLSQPDNGWLINPEDPQSITAAVRDCLADPAHVRALGITNAAAIRQQPVDDASVSAAFHALYGL